MKFFIRRNTSADNATFDVYNEQGYNKYRVIQKDKKGYNGFELVSIDGKSVCKVRKILIGSVSAYSIKAESRRVKLVCIPVSAEIKCRFYGVNWHIAGDTVSKNFGILDVDNSVIATHKIVLSDYELNVFDKANELVSVAASICIDLINTVDNRATQAV